MPASDSDRQAPQAPDAPRQVRRVFTPTVTESGEVRAGGCSLGKIEKGPSGRPVLVIPDRYRRRCQARGTDSVAVDLGELADVAQQAVDGSQPDGTKT